MPPKPINFPVANQEEEEIISPRFKSNKKETSPSASYLQPEEPESDKIEQEEYQNLVESSHSFGGNPSDYQRREISNEMS